MKLPLVFEDNLHVAIVKRPDTNGPLEENEVVKCKAKKLQRQLKKVPDGNYWILIINTEVNQQYTVAIKIKKNDIIFAWPL